MTTHIVAMGGGGFSTSEGYRATSLDRYILSLTDVPSPLVCFVPTASADSGLYISRFTNAYSHLRARTCVLTLWEGAADSVDRMDEVDVFVVGAGNTFNMLALWNAHGVSHLFAELAADTTRDVVLAGVGAGGAIWHEACTTDSYGRGIAALNHGLGLVPGSFCPHYDSEAARSPLFSRFVDLGELPSGWAADNGAAVHYVDGTATEFLAESEGSAIYRVQQDEEGVGVTRQTMRVATD
ncbi:MAG TPA: peptidase E [Dermatophilaceae bacterium]|nr:peptidase E [Dermatophilaceae bacterium]